MVRIAVETTGAHGGALWRLQEARPELIASIGSIDAGLAGAAAVVTEALEQRHPAGIAHDSGVGRVATLTLGQPPFAALQLFYAEDVAPPEADLPALAAFAARSAHALRSAERVHELEVELERTRSLLEVVAEAISQLSLTHTLETAVERIAQLLQVEQVGVFLQEDDRLRAAAGRGERSGERRRRRAARRSAAGAVAGARYVACGNRGP